MKNHNSILIPRGSGPLPAIATCHDIRHFVVCAYARCRQLGDERNMISARSRTFQSKPDGSALYHGRCYAKEFGIDALLRQPKKVLLNLTVADVGMDLAEAIVTRHSTRQPKNRKRGRK